MTFYCHAHRHARLPSFGQLKRVRIAQSLTPPPPAHSSITPMHPMSSPAPLSLAQRLPLAFLPCTLLPTVEWGPKASRLPAAGPGNPPIHPSVQCSALGGWWLRAGITRTHTLYPLFFLCPPPPFASPPPLPSPPPPSSLALLRPAPRNPMNRPGRPPPPPSSSPLPPLPSPSLPPPQPSVPPPQPSQPGATQPGVGSRWGGREGSGTKGEGAAPHAVAR